MILHFLGLLIHLSLAEFSFGQWSAAGESKSFIFATKTKHYGTQINWKRNDSWDIILSCWTYETLNCTENNEIYSANITSNGTSFISIFEIKSVAPSHHNKTWFAEAMYNLPNVDSTEREEYLLQVFYPSECPTCEIARQLNDETKVQIHCFTPKVFPETVCRFYDNINSSSENELMQGSSAYFKEQDYATKFYKSNCTYNVSAALLGPGSHRFRVVMYPNIPTVITDEIERKSEYTAPIDLLYPKALLGSDCQTNGYIKEKKWSNCTCYNNNTSAVSANLAWSKSGFVMSLEGTLAYQAEKNESFTCSITNKLNWTDSINFQPNVSYPPDFIHFNISENNFNLCNDADVTISGTCFVGESNPKSTVYLLINNSLTELKSSTNNNEYLFTKSITTAGILYVSCLAKSTEYSNSSNTTTVVTVQGPPEIPIFFVNGKGEINQRSNYFEVKNGDEITCQSKGGYPFSKNITLRCGNNAKIGKNEDQVVLKLNTNVTTGTCECVVWHEYSCTQNVIKVQFKVLENKPNTGQNFETIYLGVGVLAGSIFIVIALLFITTRLRKHILQMSSREMNEKLVNNSELYFMKEENAEMIMIMCPSYTNVVTTMSSATEAPKKKI